MVLENQMVNSEIFETSKVETTTSTVVEIAASNPYFSILVEAVTKAGLAGVLSAEGPFTVFVPTNEAFTALFKQLGVSGVKDLTAEQLTPILNLPCCSRESNVNRPYKHLGGYIERTENQN